MKLLLSLLFFIFSFSTSGAEIALTFDDAPRPGTAHFTGKERGEKLLENLKKAQVDQVAFFANTKELNAEGKSRLIQYGNAGHFIGSHSHSHLDINTTNSPDYLADLIKADQILVDIPGFIRWFRFPFLREGSTLEKRDFIRNNLKVRGYFNAYVTVNTYDWYMDELYQNALETKINVNEPALRETYVSVLTDAVLFYDSLAKSALGRSPKHTLLLHENDLAALYIGDFVQALRKKGWKIISPKEVYRDEISIFVSSHLFLNNPGRIGEVAQNKGWKEDRNSLWHQACAKKYLDMKFSSNQVFFDKNVGSRK